MDISYLLQSENLPLKIDDLLILCLYLDIIAFGYLFEYLYLLITVAHKFLQLLDLLGLNLLKLILCFPNLLLHFT